VTNTVFWGFKIKKHEVFQYVISLRREKGFRQQIVNLLIRNPLG